MLMIILTDTSPIPFNPIWVDCRHVLSFACQSEVVDDHGATIRSEIRNFLCKSDPYPRCPDYRDQTNMDWSPQQGLIVDDSELTRYVFLESFPCLNVELLSPV